MEPWKFEVNTFAVVTRTSFKLTDVIVKDHVSRAYKAMIMDTADDELADIYNAGAPLLVLWDTKFLAWRLNRGLYKGATQTFTNLLESLNENLDNWIIDIEAAGGSTKPYKEGTPAFTALFPLGRAPFNSGARDSRIAAVRVLADALALQLPLAAVATLVDAFADSMVAARHEQTQQEAVVDTLSSQVEACRLDVCDMMFRNAARLMVKYGASDMVGKGFDLAYVRDGQAPPPDDAPDAPGNFTVVAVPGAPDEVASAWDAAADATSYTLYRRLPGESAWTSLGTTTGLTLMVGGQPAGVAMEFAVTATNEAGEGARSVPETITL